MLRVRSFAAVCFVSFLLLAPGSSWPQRQPNGPPHLPFIIDHVCPGEGCRLGKWTAEARVVARRDANVASPVTFTIQPGEKITALSGRVITRKASIYKVLQDVSCQGTDVPAGTVFYKLYDDGEGYALYWYNGATHFLLLESDCTRQDVFSPASEPDRDWWVHVRNHNGLTGWIVNPVHFKGTDIYGDN